MTARDDRSEANPWCPRCENIPLKSVGAVHPEVAFFGCPKCGRQYAHKPGKTLTFRWGHPISYALYPVMFSSSPQGGAEWGVDATLRDKTPQERAAIIEEIQLELDHPTHRVRDILDCVAGEDDLREYLRKYCELGAALD